MGNHGKLRRMKRGALSMKRSALILAVAGLMAVSARADILYVTDSGSNSVSRVDESTGNTTTFATGLNDPFGIVLAPNGNFYVANQADLQAGTISQITPNGVVTAFANIGFAPDGLAVDGSGNLYVVNFGSDTVSIIPTSGSNVGIASRYAVGFDNPTGIAISPNGTMYVSESVGDIYTVSTSGSLTLFYNLGENPTGMAFDSQSNLYVSGLSNGTIYEFPAAGGGPEPFATGFSDPEGLAFDSAGDLIIANLGTGDGGGSTSAEITFLYSNASFDENITGLADPAYIVDLSGSSIVTPTSGSDGVIAPNAPQSVASGTSVTFTATPDTGFKVNQWSLNGSVVQTGGTSFTIMDATPNDTVLVTFKTSQPPTVENVYAFCSGTAPILIPVVASDSDYYSYPLSVVAVSPATDGTAIISGSAAVQYTPAGSDLKFTGSDTFQYTVSDGHGSTATASATVFSFNDAKGTYGGLIALSGQPVGAFKITLTNTGIFTASSARPALHIKGTFQPTGQYLVDIAPKNGPAVSGTLSLAPNGSLTGVLLSSGATLTITAGLEPAYTARAPAPEAGTYTLLFASPEFSGSAGLAGYGELAVSKTGSVTLHGKLGDGSALTASSRVLANGSIDLYSKLYPGKAPGEIGGALVFSSQSQTDLTGTFDWIKPPQKSGLYAGGLNTAIAVIGSDYVPPVAGSFIMPLPAQAGNATFEAPAAGVTELLTISAANKVAASGTTGLKLTFTRATGEISGSFLPAGGAKRALLGGVIFQKDDFGAGFYISGTSAGPFAIAPQ